MVQILSVGAAAVITWTTMSFGFASDKPAQRWSFPLRTTDRGRLDVGFDLLRGNARHKITPLPVNLYVTLSDHITVRETRDFQPFPIPSCLNGELRRYQPVACSPPQT